MDEIELLRAAASNANAFAELYHLHVTRVYRYQMAHVGSAQDAEDLTSQTFMAALEEFHSFRRSGSFAAWLMGIAAKKRRNDIRGIDGNFPSMQFYTIKARACPPTGSQCNARKWKQLLAR